VIKLKDELKEILESILKLSGTKHAHDVAGSLLKSFGMMWRFLEVEGIEMTNNLAEGQIRKYVIYRKKLLFTWSDWGNQFVERVLSLFLTCRLQNTSPFMQLYQAISNLS
jgi:transposase